MNNVSFRARINMTDYLKEGIKYANKEATPQEQNLFLNCLKFIQNDSKTKTFSVTGGYNPLGTATAKFSVNNRALYNTEFSSKQHWDNGYNCCVKAIPDFIRKFYGEAVFSKLSGTKHELVQKCEAIQKELDKAKMTAKINLQSLLNDLKL